ncbi:Trm112 family protein [Mariluticola halotolerans]|uniref:Trm112 family protein n=1 Tax=Mariluticola halotolerans TaxID=2909283 RepID=UPI0026E3C636|nr:Trm112 family protein [Mariluticola halotolerans]UJQ93563.1 Trm112 family protein [Mariluticola halotolerans]
MNPARYSIDPQTLEILVCPLTKTRLTLNREKTELISRAARIAFPIRSGVPLLSLEESRTLSDAEYDALKD